MTAGLRWRVAGLCLAGLALLGLSAWYAWGPILVRQGASSNSIMVIAPYWYQGTWVFDDPRVGLEREPFVAGVPEMIDELAKPIPNAKQGFRLLFSAREFPGAQKTLTWVRGESLGNIYRLDSPPMEGWICPALFKYYEAPPTTIHVRAEPLDRS